MIATNQFRIFHPSFHWLLYMGMKLGFPLRENINQGSLEDKGEEYIWT